MVTIITKALVTAGGKPVCNILSQSHHPSRGNT